MDGQALHVRQWGNHPLDLQPLVGPEPRRVAVLTCGPCEVKRAKQLVATREAFGETNWFLILDEMNKRFSDSFYLVVDYEKRTHTIMRLNTVPPFEPFTVVTKEVLWPVSTTK